MSINAEQTGFEGLHDASYAERVEFGKYLVAYLYDLPDIMPTENEHSIVFKKSGTPDV